MNKSVLIVGHGYFGGHLSERLLTDTFRIFATTRNRDRFSELKSKDISPVLFDVVDEKSDPIRHAFEAVVYCVGFDRTQGASRKQVYEDGLQNFLSKLEVPPKQFVYICSTGVYGQSNGEWVDEESRTEPTRDGGKHCLAAERILQQKKEEGWQAELTILRFAGIYGPGRIPNRSRLEQGDLQMNGDGFLNLIHVRDAAEICCWAISHPPENLLCRVYNVSDGNPSTRQEFYGCLSDLLGIESPRLGKGSSSEGSRQDGSKRVSNKKLVADSGYRFLFASYREGLVDCLHAGSE